MKTEIRNAHLYKYIIRIFLIIQNVESKASATDYAWKELKEKEWRI